MTQENKVKVTMTLEDKYLDLYYYKVQIEYWDKEVITKSKQPCFKIGSLLLDTMTHLDSLCKDLEVEFKIKNNPLDLVRLQNITGQRKEKESMVKSSLHLCDSVKEAKRLKDFLNYHNCTVA